MQTDWSRFWTHVAVSISNNGNHYTPRGMCMYTYIHTCVCVCVLTNINTHKSAYVLVCPLWLSNPSQTIFIRLIDFIGMSTCLGLFYAYCFPIIALCDIDNVYIYNLLVRFYFSQQEQNVIRWHFQIHPSY